MHNIETLSFLIASFNDVISSFGQNNKSVEFYKRQVDSLINIGQVSSADAEIIEEVIGMKNTDNVKWDSAERKTQEFIYAMNTISNISDKQAIAILLKQMCTTKQISNGIEKIVREVYDIQDTVEVKSNRFGERPKAKEDNPVSSSACALSYTDIRGRTIKAGKMVGGTFKPSISKSMFTLLTEAEKHSKYVLRVKNTEAVCSGDAQYFDRLLTGFADINKLDENHYSRTVTLAALHLLANGAPYTVGERVDTNTFPCGSSRYEIVEDKECKKKLDTISWADIKRALTE
jgi:hypothetical protein